MDIVAELRLFCFLRVASGRGAEGGVLKENARFKFSGYSGGVFNEYFSKVDKNNFTQKHREKILKRWIIVNTIQIEYILYSKTI